MKSKNNYVVRIKKRDNFTFHLESTTLKISMCSPRFKPCTFQIQVQRVIMFCVECQVLDVGVCRGGQFSVSTLHDPPRPTPLAFSLVCTPMYTFCYNTYIRPYTISYLISASLQDGADIMADVCVHAPEKNTNGCQLVLEEAHCHMLLVSQQCGLLGVNFIYYRILTV
jgi:hypothetical protein